MDRSFLSDGDVVAASRKFVCVRMATYESAEEGKLLESLFRGRSGQLENTVFTILSPDGAKKLVRAGRSPHQVFRAQRESASIARMAEAMSRIAEDYTRTKKITAVPYLADLRRGLNVAACDNRPLVLVCAKTAATLQKIEKALAPLAWSEAFVGRFEYARTAVPAELKIVARTETTEGVVVVAPDAYGQKGVALARVGLDELSKLRVALEAGLEKYAPETKDSRKHIREGRQRGIHWETEIPVTDPGGRRGREPRER